MKGMPWIAAALVWVIAASPAEGQSWQELLSPECGFRAEMPGQPRKISEKTEQGIEIQRFLLADPASGLNVIVSHFLLTDELLKEKPEPEQRLQFLREETLAGHELANESRIETPGGIGQQLEVRTAEGGAMFVRQFVVGRSMYQCGVGGRTSAAQAHMAVVRRFLDSFSLVPRPQLPAGTQHPGSSFTSAEDQFRAAFPSAPRRRPRSSKAGPSAQYSAADGQRHIVYLVDCVRLDPALLAKFRKPDDVLDRLLDGMVGDGKLLRRRRIALGSYPGRGVEIEKSESLVLVARAFLAEGRLYHVMVAGPPAAMKENVAQMRAFLDSFAVISSSGAATDRRAWRELLCAEGGFRVLLPGTPRGEARVTKKGHPHFEYRLADPDTHARYLLDFGPLPEDGLQNSATPHPVLDTFRDAIVGRGELVAEKAIALASHPGRELEIVSAEGDRVRARLYVAQGKIFQLLVSARPDSPASAEGDARKFLDSFQLSGD